MSQTDSTNNDLISRIIPVVSQFRIAEIAIKDAEQCETNISLTALNQAKNAFNHLCIAVVHYQQNDLSNADENFRKAIGHCKRAYYDACDAEITFCLAQINLFISHCRNNKLPLSDVIPDYASAVSLIIETKHFLESDQLEISDKDERYRQAQVYRDKIKTNIYNKLYGYYEVANEKINLINSLRAENEAKDADNKILKDQSTQSLRWAKISGVAGVVAIIIAILLVVFESDLKLNQKTDDIEIQKAK